METGLTLLRCKNCGTLSIPPKYSCPNCPDGILEEYAASGLGEVYSFTTIHVAPEAFKNQAPYDIALIQLKEGARVTARMKNPQNAAFTIGSKVRFCGKDGAAYWFELAPEQ